MFNLALTSFRVLAWNFVFVLNEVISAAEAILGKREK
jgi:hypothetical protein